MQACFSRAGASLLDQRDFERWGVTKYAVLRVCSGVHTHAVEFTQMRACPNETLSAWGGARTLVLARCVCVCVYVCVRVRPSIPNPAWIHSIDVLSERQERLRACVICDQFVDVWTGKSPRCKHLD